LKGRGFAASALLPLLRSGCNSERIERQQGWNLLFLKKSTTDATQKELKGESASTLLSVLDARMQLRKN
jgi:hypothetical protein